MPYSMYSDRMNKLTTEDKRKNKSIKEKAMKAATIAADRKQEASIKKEMRKGLTREEAIRMINKKSKIKGTQPIRNFRRYN